MSQANKKFFAACNRGDLEAVTTMLSSGVEPDATDRYHLTGLIYAARKGHKELAELLIKQGAAVDYGDVSGRTAFFHAVCFNRIEVAAHLAESGAKVNVVDSHGWTPLDMAISQRHVESIELLKSLGAEAKEYSLDSVPSNNAVNDSEYQAIQAQVQQAIGANTRVVFSAFPEGEGDEPVNNLDHVAIHDWVVIVAEPNDRWVDCDAKPFRSKLLNEPTWLELCVVLHEQIEYSGDDSLVVLEGVIKTGSTSQDGQNAAEYALITGS